MQQKQSICITCGATLTNTLGCDFCGAAVLKTESASYVNALAQEQPQSVNQKGKSGLVNISHQECPNCGGNISIKNDEEKVACGYCNTTVEILRPLDVSLNLAAKSLLSGDNKDKYQNYITILLRSMLAGNYEEGFNYCNKALEINPDVPELWVNKAICAYFQSTKGDILNLKAKETLTYLRTAESYDESNENLKQTRAVIASNLFALTRAWAHRIHPEIYYEKENLYDYSWNQVDKIYEYIMLYEVVYNISGNNVSYLKAAIDEFELSKTYNIGWYNDEARRRYPNIRRDVDRFVGIIRQTDPKYVIPVKVAVEQQNYNWVWWLIAIIGAIIFIISLL